MDRWSKRDVTQDEMKQMWREMLIYMRTHTIDQNNKFHLKTHRKKVVRMKMQEAADVKALVSGIDDMVTKNQDRWKEIRNKFFYYKKHVK